MTKKEQREVFSRQLSRYVERSGRQQKDIADDLDVAPTTFNNWCTGVSVPNWGVVCKVADYFKIPPTYLIDDKPMYDPNAELDTIMMSYIRNNPKADLLIELKQIIDDMPEEKLLQIVRYAKFVKAGD